MNVRSSRQLSLSNGWADLDLIIESKLVAPAGCELRGNHQRVGTINLGFWLYVVAMPRQRTNFALDQYELAVDEIVAACDGDLRDALRALMLLNEQLEYELALMRGVRAPDQTLH